MSSIRKALACGATAVLAAFGLVACSAGAESDSASETPSAASASAAPASAPMEDEASLAAATDTVTPALIAQGKRVYEGEGGAICMTCHGKDAKGVSGIGPDLTDGKWLHGDGSFEFLKRVVKEGVMQPKESPSVMPPYGGVPLSDERVAAVAAYIHSLNQKR